MSKKGDGLYRRYDKLTPEERFRLDVLAMARGDMEESERLVGSCPRAAYTMNERGFSGRWDGAMDIALRMYVPLQGLLAKLELVGAFRRLVPYPQALSRSLAAEAYFLGHRLGSFRAWGRAKKPGRPPAWPEAGADEPRGAEEDPAVRRDMDELDAKLEKYGELLPEILDRAQRLYAKEALSVWAGFAGFCAERMGVAAEKVLSAVLGREIGPEAVGRVEALEALAGRLGLEPDAEMVGAIREGLAESWRVVEARGA